VGVLAAVLRADPIGLAGDDLAECSPRSPFQAPDCPLGVYSSAVFRLQRRARSRSLEIFADLPPISPPFMAAMIVAAAGRVAGSRPAVPPPIEPDSRRRAARRATSAGDQRCSISSIGSFERP
jgi:hypothetical protein